MSGIGVDVVSLARMQAAIDDAGDAFLRRVFAPEELAAVPDDARRLAHIANRFAVKEAVFKCLRASWADDASFADIVVRCAPSGAPVVSLHGPFAAYDADGLAVSLSTDGDTAVAVAALLG